MPTEVAIRLGLDGEADVKKGMADVGQIGDAALGQVADGADKAGAALDRLTRKWQVQAAAAKQAAAASDSQASFNSVLGVGDTAPNKAGADFTAQLKSQLQAESDAATAAARLRAEIDPLSAAQARYGSAVTVSDTLLPSGNITEAEHSAALALARTRLGEAEKALTSHTGAAKLNTAQVQELTGAARHSFDALAAGANPLTVLTTHAATSAKP